MAINVNTNVSAMTAQRYLNGATDGMQKSMERLSSGYKINSARDDAAGLQNLKPLECAKPWLRHGCKKCE